jgi:hypothetical protein
MGTAMAHGETARGGLAWTTQYWSIFTGCTAILASWVTSVGNTRAARVQAEASANTQHRSQLHTFRRTAYLEFIEQAHLTGELHWQVGDVYAQIHDGDEQLKRIDDLRTELRAAFGLLQRCLRLILLEGPAPVAREAESLLEAAQQVNRRLYDISQGIDATPERFWAAHEEDRLRLTTFITAARYAVRDDPPAPSSPNEHQRPDH